MRANFFYSSEEPLPTTLLGEPLLGPSEEKTRELSPCIESASIIHDNTRAVKLFVLLSAPQMKVVILERAAVVNFVDSEGSLGL